MTLNTSDTVGQLAAGVVGYARDQDAVNVLVRALSDPRPRVARAARRVLGAWFVVPRRRLIDLYASTRQAHTRIQVLALLARGERGESMVSLLDAAAMSDGKALKQACQHLTDWLRMWAPTWWARSNSTYRKMTHETRPPSRTTWETTSETAPAWRPTCSSPTR